MKFIVTERKNQYEYVWFDAEVNNVQFFSCQFIENAGNFNNKEKRKSAQ